LRIGSNLLQIHARPGTVEGPRFEATQYQSGGTREKKGWTCKAIGNSQMDSPEFHIGPGAAIRAISMTFSPSGRITFRGLCPTAANSWVSGLISR
jgi:hypothetical protein